MRTIEEIDREIERLRRELEAVEGSPTEVYTRIVGYYRSVKAWNRGKREEFGHRKPFQANSGQVSENRSDEKLFTVREDVDASTGCLKPSDGHLVSFTRNGCPGCPPVRDYLRKNGIPYREVNVDREEGLAEARERNVLSTPTVILLGPDGQLIGEARSLDTLQALLQEIRSTAEIMA